MTMPSTSRNQFATALCITTVPAFDGEKLRLAYLLCSPIKQIHLGSNIPLAISTCQRSFRSQVRPSLEYRVIDWPLTTTQRRWVMVSPLVLHELTSLPTKLRHGECE